METLYNSKDTTTVGAFTYTSLSAPTITASGTPSAAANVLTVIGSSTTGNVVQFSNTAGGTFIMTNAGRIGIGKTNPVYPLDITGDLNFTGTFRQNGTPYVGSQWTGTSSIYFLGNVGIGTTNPTQATLTVWGEASPEAPFYAQGVNTPGAGYYGYMKFTNPTGGYGGLLINHDTSYGTTPFQNASDPPLQVKTAGYNALTVAAGTGNVGIGTTNPGYTLDVNGNINFSGAITQGGSPLSASQWTGTSAIYFAGNVGIGTTDTTYPLIVRGTGTSTAAPYSNLAYQVGGWYQAYQPSTATTLKIYTDGKIGCTEVDVFSDRRIKSDIQDSDSSKDLDTVLALRVREFRYKDPIEHGERTYTGLVAQEVKEVFPAAVSTHEGVIPDIFQVPTSFSGRVCQFTNKIEGLQVGARVKVLDESVEKFLEVVRVSDFEIEFDSEINGPKVFVYGQAVKDLHTVSYDRLVPVLISAVQELSKKLERS